MEGLGFLIMVLLLLYFLSFFFTLLLLIRFSKTKLTGGMIAGVVILSLILSGLVIYTNLVLELSLNFIMIYLLCALTAFMVSLVFPLKQHKDDPQ